MATLSYKHIPNKICSTSVTITGERSESKYGMNKYKDEGRFFFSFKSKRGKEMPKQGQK